MDGAVVVIALLVAVAVGLVVYYGAATRMSYRRVMALRFAPGLSARLAPESVLRTEGGWLPRAFRLPPATEARLGFALARAGWQMRPGEFIMLRLCAAATGVMLALVLPLRSGPEEAAGRVVLALFLGLVGWIGPNLYLGRRRVARLKRIEGQLPDALTSIAKSLRAGTGLLQGLAYAAAETPAPLGTELQATLRDLQLGADAEAAFTDLAGRIGSPDLDIAVTAIVIQRSVGGNLSEILSNVTETIRQRALLHREVQVWTTRQRVTSNLVAAVPVLIALFFVGFNPRMLELLTQTTPGRIALVVGVGFELLGIWMIRKLADIEV